MEGNISGKKNKPLRRRRARPEGFGDFLPRGPWTGRGVRNSASLVNAHRKKNSYIGEKLKKSATAY